MLVDYECLEEFSVTVVSLRKQNAGLSLLVLVLSDLRCRISRELRGRVTTLFLFALLLAARPY